MNPIRPRSASLPEPPWLGLCLAGGGLLCLGLLLGLPLAFAAKEALALGLTHAWASVTNPEALAALRLSLLSVALAAPLSALFGLAAAWLIGRFEFRGRTLLLALIDLPFAASPVVTGLLFFMAFGMQGWLGPWLRDHGASVLFAPAGIMLATAFVTFPYVAKELLPLMQSLGDEEEQAARLLGAGGWQVFLRVSLPRIRWGLAHGLLLCAARALGEFGAVSLVSGRIRGLTETLPLYIESQFEAYDPAGAFSAALLLAALSLLGQALRWGLARRAEAEAPGAGA